MFRDDVQPVLQLIAQWEANGYKRDRANASPVTEAALTLWNLGGWLEDGHPDTFELPDESFILLLATVHAEAWGNVESVAASDADRIMGGGVVKSNDAILSCIECVLATIKSANAGQVSAAWAYAIDARHLASLVIQGWDIRRGVKRALASENSAKRWASDPTQIAKAEARKLWNERHAGKHPKLRTNEQFAIECMHRWPEELTSAKVILGWCTEWNKAAKARKPQAAS
jgi:hypothetical protein